LQSESVAAEELRSLMEEAQVQQPPVPWTRTRCFGGGYTGLMYCTHTYIYIYIYILRLDKIINFYDWDNNGVGIRPLTGQQCSEKCDFTFLHCDHGWNGVMATTTACSFRV